MYSKERKKKKIQTTLTSQIFGQSSVLPVCLSIILPWNVFACKASSKAKNKCAVENIQNLKFNHLNNKRRNTV